MYYTPSTRQHSQQPAPHSHISHSRQHTLAPHLHTSHTRPLRHLPSSAFSPIAVNGSVSLQHTTPVESSAVLMDVDQVPDLVRSLPVTSLPNPLIVTSVPVATPSYVQPPAPQPVLRRVSLIYVYICVYVINMILLTIANPFSRMPAYYIQSPTKKE